MRILLTVALIGAVLAGPARAQDLFIDEATVIGPGGPAAGIDILIQDGVIAAVADEITAPEGFQRIDGRDRYVMPGLADMHVHLGTGALLPRDEQTSADVLARLLDHGVTSILVAGGGGGDADSINALRARLAAGEIAGPRLYATGSLITVPGSHPVGTIFGPEVGEMAARAAAEAPEGRPVDLAPLGVTLARSPGEARLAVRALAAAGMDGVKIVIESGPPGFGDDHPQMSADLISAVVGEARSTGLRVFAHVSSVDEFEAALDGGVAAVMHAVAEPDYPSAALLARAAERGMVYVPSLALYWSFFSYIDDPTLLDDPFLRRSVSQAEIDSLSHPGFRVAHAVTADHMRTGLPDILDALGDAHAAGVPIVAGTDTANPFTFPGVAIHRELELLVRAGLSPAQAIEAATAGAARMMGAQGEWGAITPGLAGDLVILDADPLEDIRNTRAIHTVVQGGRIVNSRPDALP